MGPASAETVRMARYVTRVSTEMAPADVFAYMADLRNFVDWDPGVELVTQVSGDGAGPDAEFDVVVTGQPRSITLRYKTLEYDAPHRVVVRADSPWLRSVDVVTVEADGPGSIVTYDAELTLKGALRLFDLGLRVVFGRIGDRAARGLRQALQGEEVPA
jgi:hypothetical protein